MQWRATMPMIITLSAVTIVYVFVCVVSLLWHSCLLRRPDSSEKIFHSASMILAQTKHTIFYCCVNILVLWYQRNPITDCLCNWLVIQNHQWLHKGLCYQIALVTENYRQSYKQRLNSLLTTHQPLWVTGSNEERSRRNRYGMKYKNSSDHSRFEVHVFLFIYISTPFSFRTKNLIHAN